MPSGGRAPNAVSAATKDLAQEFPKLWEIAREFDFAERLGGCNSALHEEVDRALRELWDSRNARAEHGL